MRRITALALLVVFASSGTSAREHSGTYYTDGEGRRVDRPMQAKDAQAGASAHCADGTYSFSENSRGSCSPHHSGVSAWLR